MRQPLRVSPARALGATLAADGGGRWHCRQPWHRRIAGRRHDAFDLGVQRATRALSMGFLVLRGDQHLSHRHRPSAAACRQCRGDAPLACAQLVEQRLQHVREAGHFVERESRGAALDGMRDAEDGVDQLGVDFAGRELQQRRLHRVERFETLFEEDVVELREIERHAGYSSSGLTAEQTRSPPRAWPSVLSTRRQCSFQAVERKRDDELDARGVDVLHAARRRSRRGRVVRPAPADGRELLRFLDGAGRAEHDAHLPRGTVAARGLPMRSGGNTGTGTIAGTATTGATAAKGFRPRRVPAAFERDFLRELFMESVKPGLRAPAPAPRCRPRRRSLMGRSSHPSSDFHGFSVRPTGSPHRAVVAAIWLRRAWCRSSRRFPRHWRRCAPCGRAVS